MIFKRVYSTQSDETPLPEDSSPEDLPNEASSHEDSSPDDLLYEDPLYEGPEDALPLPLDVVPEYRILISVVERLSVALPTAALAVSLAMGHAIGGLVSAAVLLVAILMIAFRDDRSRRRAWRKRRPELPWAEYEASDVIHRLLILQVIAWAVVYVAALAALLWGPKSGTSALMAWTGVGVLALVVVFFLPGFNTIDEAAASAEIDDIEDIEETEFTERNEAAEENIEDDDAADGDTAEAEDSAPASVEDLDEEEEEETDVLSTETRVFEADGSVVEDVPAQNPEQHAPENSGAFSEDSEVKYVSAVYRTDKEPETQVFRVAKVNEESEESTET